MPENVENDKSHVHFDFITSMNNYYKYLPVSREDEAWGLCVLNAGSNRIGKNEAYPPPGHPVHHYFNWDKGRIFDEFQVIYITKGEGSFESESCPENKIKEGTVIFLFPNEWHRFRPVAATGWDEYWVGFKGPIADQLIRNNFINPSSPLLSIGIQDHVISILTEIIEKTREEKPGYQPLISGAVLHLLGHIHSISRQKSIEQADAVENVINRARVIFRTISEKNISIEQVAEELGVSYSWFRKTFKSYTGIAPGQYLLQLKIERAKMLLSDPSKSVKEIAFILNFESAFYFSKLFKEKTGLSPERYRKNREL